ncbi:acyl--CoA ligase [Pseudoalteromonas sp. C2R02]|uniref:class I adenylate-forming enzyme family protein n=1 Tax=Pseudoalteromonas sp. C2R02 TaxID=2841565 RepID=UPI001C09E0F5|nr:class I adenylate-forming enzyme family protein [Pseudoalteromonas sp. C2R02]MBU2971751.1 acyl--CoA ligase [Pseudoalteromonas sp. C2R02]
MKNAVISNVAEELRGIFKRFANRTLMIDRYSGREYSYAEFQSISLKGAVYLKKLQLCKGDTIVVICENCFELPLLFVAAWTVGVKVVPINADLSAAQITDIIASADPKACFVSQNAFASLDTIHDLFQTLSTIVFSPEYMEADEKSSVSLTSIWHEHQESLDLFEYLEDDFSFLRIYTSGSTAAPKGIDVSASRLIGNEQLFCKAMKIDKDNRFYNLLPMSYLGGVHNLFLLPMSVGGSFVIDQPLGPSNVFGFWDYVKNFDINTLWFSPTMLTMLMALRDEDDILEITQKIKLALVGMAPLSQTTKSEFEQRFQFELRENFALSETTFITSQLPGVMYDENCKGDVLAGVQIEIIDPNGQSLDEKQEGEVFVNTPFLMKGYINAKQTDLDAITPTGFKTGDLGYLDGGKLYIVGRAKDLIIRGGLNISPALVESEVAKLPYIQAASVVGIENKYYGEEVAAAIILRQGQNVTVEQIEDDLGKILPVFQVPKSILLVSEFPQGLTGKIDKKQIRKMFDT